MKLSLTLEEATKLSRDYNVIPVHARFILDMDTPVSLYVKSGAWQRPYSFLLESVMGGENRGRYSYVGLENHLTIKGKNSSFEVIYTNPNSHSSKNEILENITPLEALSLVYSRYELFQPDELSGFYAGLLGFFSYDMVRYYEPTHAETSKGECNTQKKDFVPPAQTNDMIYVIPRLIIWVDHTAGSVQLIRNLFISENNTTASEYKNAGKEISDMINTINSEKYKKDYFNLPKPEFQKNRKLEWESNTSIKDYIRMIEKAKEYIRQGDIFQVVLGKRFSRKYAYDPFFLYRGLRVTNPSPYMFYLNFPESVVIGSSPEILVKKQDDQLTLRPIAGTIRRGKNKQEDKSLSQELLNNPKERAEHVMLVDLGRNDMGRVCEFGSISMDEYMVIEKYSHVMHIVSNLVGRLKLPNGSFESIQASFPAGTISGAPKVRAMQIIEELEKEPRGPYGGCIGYFNFNGDMDTAITLRTMWVQNHRLYIQAGAGIVFDSQPKLEDDEVFRKAEALFRAVEVFYSGALEKS